MNSVRRWLACGLILTLLLSTAGCTTFERFSERFEKDTSDGEVIRIGVLEPLSGEDAKDAKAELMGIELAHELYPDANGVKIELVYADTKSSLSYVESAAQELIEQDVTAVIGCYGNPESLAAGAIFKNAEIPIIGATSTNPLVTAGNPYYFRVCIVDSFQGTMAAKYVYNDLEEETAVVLKQIGDDYGSALSQAFSDKMTAMTEEEDAVFLTVEYSKGTKDFSKQLAMIEASNAEVVFLPCDATIAAQIIKQARAAGLTNLFLGTELWYQEQLLVDAGSAAEGLVLTTFSDVETTLSQNTQTFLDAYAKKYQTKEAPKSNTALGFDAYLLAVNALKRQAKAVLEAPEEPEPSLRDVLQETKEFQGATGSLAFGESGDPIKPVVFMTVKNGEFIYKYTATPEWGN